MMERRTITDIIKWLSLVGFGKFLRVHCYIPNTAQTNKGDRSRDSKVFLPRISMWPDTLITVFWFAAGCLSIDRLICQWK